MPAVEQEPGIRHAASELQRYLSDEIAPMMAVEYFEELAAHPPEVTAQIIAQWIASQRPAPNERVTTADLIYHALRKLSLLSELELVRRATMMRAIHEVSRALLRVCPEGQRDELRLRLSHLGETETVLASRSQFLHREAGVGGLAAGVDVSEKVAPMNAKPTLDAPTADRGAQVLSLLLSGLAKLRKPNAPPEKEGAEAALIAQVLATAALESKTNDDLARHLARVEKEGVATPMAQVFRTLGWSLPGWGPMGEEARRPTRGAGSSGRWTGSSRSRPMPKSAPSAGAR
jgi:hypothetical protein